MELGEDSVEIGDSRGAGIIVDLVKILHAMVLLDAGFVRVNSHRMEELGKSGLGMLYQVLVKESSAVVGPSVCPGAHRGMGV